MRASRKICLPSLLTLYEPTKDSPCAHRATAIASAFKRAGRATSLLRFIFNNKAGINVPTLCAQMFALALHHAEASGSGERGSAVVPCSRGRRPHFPPPSAAGFCTVSVPSHSNALTVPADSCGLLIANSSRHQLAGSTTLRHGCTVALKRPDGAVIPCLCRAYDSSGCGPAPHGAQTSTGARGSVEAGAQESVREQCTWDTKLVLAACFSSPPPQQIPPGGPKSGTAGESPVVHNTKHDGIELAIHSEDLRHRLCTLLDLALLTPQSPLPSSTAACRMRPSDAILLHGPAGSGKTTILRDSAVRLGIPVVSLEQQLFGHAHYGPHDPSRER
jgi:hypothetical protein